MAKKVQKSRAKRFQIAQLIDISNNRENFIPAQGINVSKTGILVETPEDIEIHSRIYFLLQYPGSEESFEMEGIVVRGEKKGKKYEIGMEFIFDYSEQKKELQKFIDLL